MKFRSLEELLDELLKELARLRLWSDDLIKRIQENNAALDELAIDDPANLKRLEELLNESDDLKAELARFDEEYEDTIEKSRALTGFPRDESKDKSN